MAKNIAAQISKQLQNVPAPWQAEAEAENPELAKPQMFLCHMMDEELQALDTLQRGVSIDPETGVREYSAIAPILENPEIVELFMIVYNDLADDGKLTEPLQKAYDEAQRIALPYRETPAEKTKEIDKLEDLGEGGDNKLAFLPENLVRLLISLRGGEPSLNSKTGLMEFGFFDEVVRVVGTVGGAILGGPVGAGIGNALGHAVTGNNLQNSIMSGVKNFGLFQAGASLGNALGIGSVAGTGGIGAMLGMGSAGAGMPGQEGMAGAKPTFSPNQIGQMTPSAGGVGNFGNSLGSTGNSVAGLLKGTDQAATQSVQPGLMEKLGNLVSGKGFQALSSLGTMGLGYLGEKHQHKQNLEAERRQRDYISQIRKDRGFDEPFSPKKYRRTNNPNFNPTEEDMAMGRYPEPEYNLEEYAHGGNVSYREGNIIKGPGNGQQDKIKTHVPVNSEIIDATSVSMLGDGSSEAGAQILKRMEHQIKKSVSPKQIHSFTEYFEKHKGQAPVYLSNDEYRIDPVAVSIIGNGNPDRGSLEFRKMVKNLRKHKMSNGLELPPPAKNPFEYMKGA